MFDADVLIVILFQSLFIALRVNSVPNIFEGEYTEKS